MVKKSTFIFATMFLVSAPSTFAATVSPTPSPSPSALTISICAPISTGIPQKIQTSHCPSGMYTLGRGPVLHSLQRPHGMHPHLKNRFLSAQRAGKNLGFNISIRSGWRSWNTQGKLYRAALIKYKSERVAQHWVLPPERSMHVWGVAIDIHFATTAARTWFKWNSAHFGLCRTYKNEWWHFEPVISPGDKCPAMQPFAK